MQVSNSRRRKLILRTPRAPKKFPLIGQRIIRKISDLDRLLMPLGLRVNLESSDYARDLFCRLSLAAQRRAFQALSLYVETIEDLIRHQQSPFDARVFTWAFLKKAGLHPNSRTFESIEKTEIVEIFNRDFTQVFRSLSFFEKFDTPFFDLLILDRMTVLRSQAKLEEKIFLKMDACLKQKRGVETLDLAEAEWEERFGLDPRHYLIRYKMMSSLMARGKRPGRVSAVLMTSSAEIQVPQLQELAS